jgi:hypothetical protein
LFRISVQHIADRHGGDTEVRIVLNVRQTLSPVSPNDSQQTGHVDQQLLLTQIRQETQHLVSNGVELVRGNVFEREKHDGG